MNELKKTVALALSNMGALGAQLYSARAALSQTNEFNVDGGKFSLYRTTRDAGLSLVAIKDQKRGQVTGNSFEEQAVKLAVADCLAAADAAQADPAWDMASEGKATSPMGPIPRIWTGSLPAARKCSAKSGRNTPRSCWSR